MSAEHGVGVSQERRSPQATLNQTIDRIAGTINGTAEKDHPLMLWEDGKKRGEEFRAAYEADPSHKIDFKRLTELSEWIKADEASSNSQLARLAQAYIDLWNKVTSPGHPGHDKRHLMQDLKAGLTMTRDLVASGSSDMAAYQKVMLLGSLMHDFGRLAEVHATGTIAGGEAGKEHPKASFVITQEILNHFSDIPQSLRDHVAYSVLVHQDWVSDPTAGSYDFIMNQPGPRIVQSGDRQQLFGPEGSARFLQYDVGIDGKDLVGTIDEERKTKIDRKAPSQATLPRHAEYYARTHRPVDLPLVTISEAWPEELRKRAKEENEAIKRSNERTNLQARQREAVTGTFLMLGWPHLKDEIFAPELEVDRRESQSPGSGRKWREENEDVYKKNEKNFFKPEVWESIKQQAKEAQTEGTELNRRIKARVAGRSLEDLAIEMVSADNMARQPDEVESIKRKLQAVTDPKDRDSLLLAFGYNRVKMDDLENEHQRVLQEIQDPKNREIYPPHGLEQPLAKFASLPGKKAA